MGEPSPYQYTYKDIERYHSGQMSVDEMHQMEMAALDDPFLADALEGYTYTSTPTSDIEKLNERLNERTKRRASGLWISKKYNALKVAAVLLFVIAGSWLLVVSKQKPTDLALEKKLNTVNKETAKSTQDSTKLYKNDDSNKDIKANEPSTAAAPLSKRKIKQHIKEHTSDNDVAVLTPKSNTEVSQPALNAPAKDNASVVQIAPAARIGEARAFRAESKQEKDSTDKLSGYALNAKKQSNDTVKNVDVVLKPQAVPGLSEVVVTGYGANRKSKRSALAVKDTLEPEEGWDKYNGYISNNIKSIEENKPIFIAGEVELSFDVDQAGRPINIKVEKSLCDPCDTEAVRILKEGPNWKKKKNKKGKLMLHF